MPPRNKSKSLKSKSKKSKSKKQKSQRKPKTKSKKKSKTIKKSQGKTKSSTSKIKEQIFLQENIPFLSPKNLIKKGNFLVWKDHPWISSVQVPIEEDTISALQPKHISLRTKGWGAIFPKTSWERTALALVAPEAFLVYEMVPRPSWGTKMFKINPKFPVVQRLPPKLQEAIVNDENRVLTAQEYAKLIKMDIRGLNAAYNRARQHESKYSSSLPNLIKKLQAKVVKQTKNKNVSS